MPIFSEKPRIVRSIVPRDIPVAVLWELLAEATMVPLDAELWMLFEDLDNAIDSLAIEEQILVAGEGIAQMGRS